MVRQRTTPILVIAILHLVGGGMGLLGSCYTITLLGVAQASPAPTVTQKGPSTPPSTSEVMRYCAEHVPGYWAGQIGSLAASLVLDIILLAAGIGLLKMQPWARTLSLVYAPLSILFHIVSFIYQVVLVAPAMTDAYAQYPAFASMSKFMGFVFVAAMFASLLVIIYPIVVVVIMLRRNTVAAFRGEASVADRDETIADGPWREPPSQRMSPREQR